MERILGRNQETFKGLAEVYKRYLDGQGMGVGKDDNGSIFTPNHFLLSNVLIICG